MAAKRLTPDEETFAREVANQCRFALDPYEDMQVALRTNMT
jgi:hypothetical protein